MSKEEVFAKVIDIASDVIRYTLIVLVVAAVLALATGDVWIGAGSLDHIFQDNQGNAEWWISLATTGVLAALLVIPAYGIYRKWAWWKILIAVLPALVPYCFDAYFDMKFADVLMYGTAYVNTALIPIEERSVLYMLRGLMLAITSLGDPITALIVIGLPIVAIMLTNGKPAHSEPAHSDEPAPAGPAGDEDPAFPANRHRKPGPGETVVPAPKADHFFILKDGKKVAWCLKTELRKTTAPPPPPPTH